MKINNIISILCFLLIFSCNKKTENKKELDILRTSTNIKTYPVGKMDSIQAIKSITQQKVQELLDLSALYINGNQNTQIDSAMLKQMRGYFYKPDSLTFKTIFDDLKTNNVKYIKVNQLEVSKIIKEKDTIDLAKFNVEYFNKNNKSIGNFSKNAEYILVTPNKMSKEFKFYFLNFYHNNSGEEKDSTSVGNTK